MSQKRELSDSYSPFQACLSIKEKFFFFYGFLDYLL